MIKIDYFIFRENEGKKLVGYSISTNTVEFLKEHDEYLYACCQKFLMWENLKIVRETTRVNYIEQGYDIYICNLIYVKDDKTLK